MLAYFLALLIGSGSIALYLAAFFVPEIHRKHDLVWSGVGMFYALVLWVCADRITGGVLLGQVASASLIGWLAWQTLRLRRNSTPLDLQTPLPSASELRDGLGELTSSDGRSRLAQQVSRQVQQLAGGVQATFSTMRRGQSSPMDNSSEGYVALKPENFGTAAEDLKIKAETTIETIASTTSATAAQLTSAAETAIQQASVEAKVAHQASRRPTPDASAHSVTPRHTPPSTPVPIVQSGKGVYVRKKYRQTQPSDAPQDRMTAELEPSASESEPVKSVHPLQPVTFPPTPTSGVDEATIASFREALEDAVEEVTGVPEVTDVMPTPVSQPLSKAESILVNPLDSVHDRLEEAEETVERMIEEIEVQEQTRTNSSH